MSSLAQNSVPSAVQHAFASWQQEDKHIPKIYFLSN